MTNTPVLVTGANSLLGSLVSQELSKKYYPIYLTSRTANKSSHIHALDLQDFENIQKTIREIKPEMVIHMGSFVDLSRDYKTGLKCIETNIKGTLNLIEAMRIAPPKKIIYTSTEEIYGNNSIPFIETQVPQPPSLYAVSKLAGEHICTMFAKEFGVELTILRIATYYGPGQSSHRFIPQMIQKALKGEKVSINSGQKKRDYIYVDDVVDAVQKAAEIRFENAVEIINIGGGHSYTLEHVAKLIVKKAKTTSIIIKNAFPERIGEADEWLMDITKAKKLLNWEPRTSLQNGIEKEVAYFKNKLSIF